MKHQIEKQASDLLGNGTPDEITDFILGADETNSIWHARAKSFLKSVMGVLCEKRDTGGVEISGQSILNAISAGSDDAAPGVCTLMIEDEGKWARTEAGRNLYAFLMTVPGFPNISCSADMIISQKTREQMEYLSMQITKPVFGKIMQAA